MTTESSIPKIPAWRLAYLASFPEKMTEEESTLIKSDINLISQYLRLLANRNISSAKQVLFRQKELWVQNQAAKHSWVLKKGNRSVFLPHENPLKIIPKVVDDAGRNVSIKPILYSEVENSGWLLTFDQSIDEYVFISDSSPCENGSSWLILMVRTQEAKVPSWQKFLTVVTDLVSELDGGIESLIPAPAAAQGSSFVWNHIEDESRKVKFHPHQDPEGHILSEGWSEINKMDGQTEVTLFLKTRLEIMEVVVQVLDQEKNLLTEVTFNPDRPGFFYGGQIVSPLEISPHSIGIQLRTA